VRRSPLLSNWYVVPTPTSPGEARRIVDELGGELACDSTLLESFEGIGPKCANLTLGIACGQARVSVDVHVHRVTNRWGYVETSTPERTSQVLQKLLPELPH
jgi:endonuclease III